MTFTKTSRRQFLSMAALAAVGAPALSHAQTYPARAVRLVNPFAPGGSADVVSRLIAAALGPKLGGTVFVDNVPGAGGTIGSDRVAKAAADGYTLLLSNVASQAIAPGLYPRIGYDAVKDFEHVALIGSFPNVLVVGPSVKASTVSGLIAEAKARPGSMSFGSAGNGSTPHLSAELFKLRTGVDAQHIPYRGAGPALVALMGGELSFQFENLSTAIPQVKAGKLRALAVTSASRVDALPDVPTMQEAGVADFVVGSWYGLSAPPRTPAEVLGALRTAMVEVLNDPTQQARLLEIGLQVSTLDPAAYTGFVTAEIKRWDALIKSSGAKVD